MPVYRGPGGAGDATNDATVTAVQAAATSAATSATNAANSATAAANSATGAATSATNASNSATNAAGQATTAAGHATNASTFATNSSLSADDSADSATEAEGYASEAFNYKVAASLSEGNASDYADAAQASQLAAETAALAVDGVLTDPDFITVLGLSDELQTVANNSANITAVANNAANINAVEANETNIDLVAANISDIGIVAENEVSVDTVAGIAANVTTVAGISANVTTVAGISSNVTTVATNNANVTTVATNIASVNTNATNIANINQNAANIVAIQGASANATAAASSATAAAGSATSASASAAAASAVALGNEPVRHSVRPSLLLDFANTKTLDPRITFTRASTGTFYDGKTVAKAEENLLQYSQEFDNAYWSKNGISISANTTVAPDGTTTADTIVCSGTTAHVLEKSFTAENVQRTASIFAKADTNNFLQIRLSTDTSIYANFDLSTGALGTVAGGTASITASTNGFYRCVLTFTSATAAGIAYNVVTSGTAARNEINSLSTNIIVWGAQMEQRSSVTAYTATTTAPITNYIPALQSAAAGVARFEHNPVTGESLGLEIEEQRTNLLTYSDDFANAAWTKTASTVTSNTIIAPDGTLTGDKLIADNTSGTHPTFQNATLVSGTSYTQSIYIKKGEYSFLNVYVSSGFDVGSGNYINFDANTGTVSTSNGFTGTITSVGNGWYRCTISNAVANATSGRLIMRACPTALVYNAAFTGDGYSGLYIWGAQLEAGSFATSYIPTVASQVTRSADSASMTGTNFSSWYRADEGTLYINSVLNHNATNFEYMITLAETTDTINNFWAIRPSSLGRLDFPSGISGNNVIASGNEIKAIATVKRASAAGYLNATQISTSSTYAMPSNIGRLLIGFAPHTADFKWNGYIKKISYYPLRLTNAELQGLTTV